MLFHSMGLVCLDSQVLSCGCLLPAGELQPNVSPCFVETSRVAVCRGPYPTELVKAWHEWDAAHGSENEPVDILCASSTAVSSSGASLPSQVSPVSSVVSEAHGDEAHADRGHDDKGHGDEAHDEPRK